VRTRHRDDAWRRLHYFDSHDRNEFPVTGPGCGKSNEAVLRLQLKQWFS
jgi:hypothetical protein